MNFSKNGGVAPEAQKCEVPRENATRYGFTPRKRCGFLPKRSQTMSKTSETMLKNSDTTHKPTIETRERKSMNSPRSTADREGGLEFDQ
jgi:hypothetical protein